MRQNKPIAKFLFTLFFIILPALIGYWLFLPGWDNDKRATWVYYVGALGFILYVTLISYITILFKYFSWDVLAIFLPLALALGLIFVSSDWHIALRIIVVLLSIGSVIPINIAINKYLS